MEVEKYQIIDRIMMVNRSIKAVVLLISITSLKTSAIPPWSFYDDFNSDQSTIGRSWSVREESFGQLSYWPDNRTNAIFTGTALSYRADDEVEQNGIVNLREPDGYNNSLDGWNGNEFWNITENSLLYPSWAATFRVNFNSSFTPSSSGGLLEGGLLISIAHPGHLPTLLS